MPRLLIGRRRGGGPPILLEQQGFAAEGSDRFVDSPLYKPLLLTLTRGKGLPLLVRQTAQVEGNDRFVDAPLTHPLLMNLARHPKVGLPLLVSQNGPGVFAPEGNDRCVAAPLYHPLLIKLETMRRVPLLQATQVQASAVGGAGTPEIVAAGIATAEAIGQPAVGATISGAGATTAESLGQPAVAVTIAATGIATAEALGAPAVSVEISSTGIASSEAFGSAAVSVEAADTSPETGGYYYQVSPRQREPQRENDAVVVISSAGGIASAEAFGLVSITLSRSRAMRRREEESLRKDLQ